MQVHGQCESGFGRIADVFAAQLESGRDIGGSVGVYSTGNLSSRSGADRLILVAACRGVSTPSRRSGPQARLSPRPRF